VKRKYAIFTIIIYALFSGGIMLESAVIAIILLFFRHHIYTSNQKRTFFGFDTLSEYLGKCLKIGLKVFERVNQSFKMTSKFKLLN
jgi:hypothetical protein